MTNKNNVSNLIVAHKAKSDLAARDPRVGDSVHFGFRTDGNGKRIKKGSEIPFDKIVNLYAEKETDGHGNPLFSVQVASGDVVKVSNTGKSAWEAVA